MLDARELKEEALLAALIGISEMMGDLTDPDELLEAIVRIAPRLASVDRCAIFLRRPRAAEFYVAHAFSPDPAATAHLLRLTIREADIERLAHRLLNQKLPILMREGRGPLLPTPVAEAFRVKSMLLVPLAYHDEGLGFITVDEVGKDHLFTSREVNVVNAIASHAAVALAHMRLVEAARLERRRYDVLAAALCDGVVTLDPQLRIVSLNPGAEGLLGWRSADVAGRPSAEVFDDPEGSGDITTVAHMVLAGAAPGSTVLRFRAKDGSYLACLTTGARVPASSGEPAEIVLAFTKVEGDPALTKRHPARRGEG